MGFLKCNLNKSIEIIIREIQFKLLGIPNSSPGWDAVICSHCKDSSSTPLIANGFGPELWPSNMINKNKGIKKLK